MVGFDCPLNSLEANCRTHAAIPYLVVSHVPFSQFNSHTGLLQYPPCNSFSVTSVCPQRLPISPAAAGTNTKDKKKFLSVVEKMI